MVGGGGGGVMVLEGTTPVFRICDVLIARLDLFKKLGIILKDRSTVFPRALYEKIREITCTKSTRFLKQKICEFSFGYTSLSSQPSYSRVPDL